MNDLLSKNLKTASIDASGWRDCGKGRGCREGKFINWLTLKYLAKGVLEDVSRIKSHSLVSADVPVYGLVYDVTFGRRLEVSSASEAGRASR
jgi:carbonic anhydrase